jgi:hypothetical protein
VNSSRPPSDAGARRVKRTSSRSKRLIEYWVEIGMRVLVVAFLCSVVLYNLVNRIRSINRCRTPSLPVVPA